MSTFNPESNPTHTFVTLVECRTCCLLPVLRDCSSMPRSDNIPLLSWGDSQIKLNWNPGINDNKEEKLTHTMTQRKHYLSSKHDSKAKEHLVHQHLANSLWLHIHSPNKCTTKSMIFFILHLDQQNIPEGN